MGIFSAPQSTPYVPPQIAVPPPPPEPVDRAAIDAAAKTRAKAAASAGLGSTLITGGQGDLTAANTTDQRLQGGKQVMGA